MKHKVKYVFSVIIFPPSTVIDEIIYYSSWGNDTPRAYSIEMHMDRDDYEKFITDDFNNITIQDVEQDGNSCIITIAYTSDRYTPFASWMTENGTENMGYKRAVSGLLFLLLIFVSLLPLFPFRKIIDSLKQILNPL